MSCRYIANDTIREETFFYHNDYLGSTPYITDEKAKITQYDAYLPYVNSSLTSISYPKTCRVSSIVSCLMKMPVRTIMMQDI